MTCTYVAGFRQTVLPSVSRLFCVGPSHVEVFGFARVFSTWRTCEHPKATHKAIQERGGIYSGASQFFTNPYGSLDRLCMTRQIMHSLIRTLLAI